jgi:enolase
MEKKITNISAMEILDSRGNPTVRVFCKLANGIEGSACRSERISKFNRLLENELKLGKAAVFGNPLR